MRNVLFAVEEQPMPDIALTRSRTTGSTVLGGALVLVGVVVLANAAVATRVSVQFLGWMLVLSGAVGLVAALAGLRSGGSASHAIGAAVLLALGLMCLRNVEAAAVTLTLVAGAVFLLSGIVRLVLALGDPDRRVALMIGGVISTALGLVVLLNLFEASYALLGVLIGVQLLAEGVTMVLVGGITVTTTGSQAAPSAT
jgi:uncharacterized membrane protein HdeD (DUF308 family)